MKNQKGITLIALIITIIVMLILVGVSVSIALNTGLFKTTQGAAKNTQKAADAEQKLAEGKIKIGDNWYASYQDYLDGIVLETGIVLDEKAVLEVEEGYNAETTPKVTKEITISLNGIEGEITLENTDNTVATIDKEKAQSGDKITITALKVGTTIITATCGDETAECKVTVKVPTVLQVGSYVRYDVTYKDVYSTEMPKFTADNGWRYLGKDSEGNHLIVSTGIPAILYYHYSDANTIGNKIDREDGGGNDWWATNAEITALPTTSQYYTDKGYVYTSDTSTSGYPNKYATYGMRYKFESIPFAKSSSVTKNSGIYTEIDSETTEVTGSVFRATGFEDETKVQIRNLTLEDLNRATNAANGNSDRAETYRGFGFKDITGTDNVALGLFDMWDLTGYGESAKYFYWLTSPFSVYTSSVCYVYYYESHCNQSYHGYRSCGVRPVVVLSSEFFDIVESEVEGVYEIESK